MINLAKNSNFTSSLIRNSLVQLFWWVIFFPGFFSADSFAAVNMARTGELTNSYTASWALYVRIFSFHGNAIWLLTLINGIILVYSLTAFSYSVFKQSTAAISSFLLTLTPLVWAMGITLWHDILMTAGLLLLVTFYTNMLKIDSFPKSQLIFHLLLGSILVTFRPNGLPTTIVFSLFLFFYNRKVRTLKFTAISFVISIAVTIFTSLIILGLSPINTYYAQEWMRNDLSCFASTKEGTGFIEANIPEIGTTEEWKSAEACTFLNTSKLNKEELQSSKAHVPNAWVKLAKDKPIFIITTHAKRNAYLLPVPIYGLPHAPFLHSTIEYSGQKIEWAFSNLANQSRFLIRSWNAMRGVIAWAGLWMIIIMYSYFKFKKLEVAPTLIMSISSLSVLLVVAPIPDARYALFTIMTGQMIFLGQIANMVSKPNSLNIQ